MLPTSSVGRKLLMAATGQLMIVYVAAHLLGNLTIFAKAINAYAAALHSVPLLLWAIRAAMFVVLCLHVFFGIQLTLENNASRPERYVKQENQASTFAGRNMVWTGALIGAFLVFHLLHFTFQTIDPASAARTHLDAAGRPDVLLMVARGLQRIGFAVLYAIAVSSLWLHLSHGIQSSFQTWGLNGERSFPYIRRGGSVAALTIWLAYLSIPLALATGFLLR